MPYFDLTVSAVKSVSVLHASYRVAARQARGRGDQDQAAVLDARADADRGRADGLRPRSRRLAGAARHLHPHRAPFGPHGGVARRRRPGRQLVPAPPVPRRRPAAARARRDLEPGPARRRRRRQVADPGFALAAQPAARRRPGRRPDPGDQAVRPRLRHGAAGGRQRRRGRRRQPGRDRPVQLPRGRSHRRAGPPGPGVPGGARQPPSRRTLWLLHQQAGQNTRRTKAAGAAHHRRADRCGRAHRGAAARRLGSPDRAPRSARAVGGARAGRGVRRRALRACTGRAG